MKLFKDDKCYVYLTDIVRYPTPSYLVFDVETSKGCLVVIEDAKSIEYIRNRKDILDYSEVSTLSRDELINKYNEAHSKLNRLAQRMLDTPLASQGKLYRDKEYMDNYKYYKFRTQDLLEYINNKEMIDERMNDGIKSKDYTLLRSIRL
jgi:hypothetical protein